MALGLLVLLSAGAAGCAATTTRRATAPATSGPDDLASTRAQAALAQCPPGVSTALPDLVLPCLGGGPAVRVRTAPGRPTLVNFYNVFCPPCQDEIPLLVRYREQAGAVGLVGVDAEDRTSDALAFVRDFGSRWPVVEDPDGRLFRQFAGGWPVTVAVEADGTLAGSPHVGAFKSVADIEQYVAAAFGS